MAMRDHHLPPLVDKNSKTIYRNKSPLQKQLSDQTSRVPRDSRDSRERNPFLRAQTIPLGSEHTLSQAQKAIDKRLRVRHVENVPNRPPGSAYTVLPPIGEKKLTTKRPKTSGLSKKYQISDEDQSTKTHEHKKRKIQKRKLQNPNETIGNMSNMEDIVVTMDEATKHRMNFERAMRNCEDDDDDDDDDDDRYDINDHDADNWNLNSHQLIEWSDKLRAFLDSKFSSRRGATCTELDPELVHVPNILRDIILCNTMDELLLW